MAEDQKHPDDPSPNPFPLGHPAHAIWKNATRAAQIELHRLKQEYLEKACVTDKPLWQVLRENRDWLPEFHARTVEAQQQQLAEFIFRRFQIWAKRAINIVRDEQDAQEYQRWLTSHRDSELKLWTEHCPEIFDPERFAFLLKRNLQRACEYWSAAALEQVTEIETLDVLARAGAAVQGAGAPVSPELRAALEAAGLSGRDGNAVGDEVARLLSATALSGAGSVLEGADIEVAANAQIAEWDFPSPRNIEPLKIVDESPRADNTAPTAGTSRSVKPLPESVGHSEADADHSEGPRLSPPAHPPPSFSTRDAKIHESIGADNFRALTNAEIMRDRVFKRQLRQFNLNPNEDASKSCLDRIRRAKGYPLSRDITKKRSARP